MIDAVSPGGTPSPPRRTAQRALLLVLCLGLGLAIGFAGYHYTAAEVWFLAVPICLAIGWFLVADPTACTPRAGKDAEGDVT